VDAGEIMVTMVEEQGFLQMLEVMFMMQATCCLMLIFQELVGSDDLEAPCE
jgi:hypothetical protein